MIADPCWVIFVPPEFFGAWRLSIMQTTLVYVGIPAAVIAAVYGLVFARGVQRSKRYRPGRPFEFRPVWFLTAPEQMNAVDGARALSAGAHRAALTSGSEGSVEWPSSDGQQTATGGASDRW